MSYRLLFISLGIVLLNTANCYSQPPSEINLSYDAEMKNLHVEIKHVTSSTRDHHIQKVYAYKNDQEFYGHGFPTQNRAWGHELDISLEAKTGDLILLKTKCNKTGYSESELTIP